MRKRLFGRLLSIVLSATLAITPAMTAYATEPDAEPAPEEATEDAEETEEAAPAEEEEEEVPAETPETPVEEKEAEPEETPAPEEEAGEVEEEAPEEEAEPAPEEEEQDDLLNAYRDVELEFIDDTNASIYQIGAGDVVSPISSASVNSDYDYSFYVIPTTGYSLATVPVSIGYTVTVGDETPAKVEAPASDFTVSALTDEEKSLTPYSGAYSKDGALAIDKPYWDAGVKVTLKGGEGSFLDSYIDALIDAAAATASAGALTPPGPATTVSPIAVKANAAIAETYNIPVYTLEETGSGETLVQTVGETLLPDGIDVTYATAVGTETAGENIFGAIAYNEWENYTAAIYTLGLDDKWEKLAVSDSIDTPTEVYNASGIAYWIDQSPEAVASEKVQVYINSNAISAEYIANNNELIKDVAIMLKKNTPTPAAAEYTITAESNNFAKFYYGNAIYDGKGKRNGSDVTSIYKAIPEPSTGKYSLVSTDAGATTDAKAKRKVYLKYQIGSEEETSPAAPGSDGWSVAGGPGNVILTAVTSEEVMFTDGGFVGPDKNSVKVHLINNDDESENIFSDAATASKDVYSADELNFIVDPIVGHEVESVTYSMYSSDASAMVVNTRTLTPVNGVYTIPSVTGYTLINIATTALTDTLKVTATTTANFADAVVADYRTREAINADGGFFAASGKKYSFKVKTLPGYKLADTNPVVVTGVLNETETNLPVTAESEAGVYSVTAPTDGVINIKVNTTQMLDIAKVDNKFADVSIAGLGVIEKGKTYQYTAGKEITITATGLNGAEVTEVWYSNIGNKHSAADASADNDYMKKATLKDGKYVITQAEATTFRTATRTTMYIYVLTSRYAVEGTDFTAKFTNKVDIDETAETQYEDVTDGISIYADGNKTLNSINDPNALEINASFSITGGTDPVVYPATGFDTATRIANAADADAGIESEDRTKIVVNASVVGTTATLDPEDTYTGGTATYASDELIATESKASLDDWKNTVVYQASAPIKVYPLNSYYASVADGLTIGVTTPADLDGGLAEDEIRVGTADEVVLTPGYESDRFVESGLERSKVDWSVSPVLSLAAVGYEYELNGTEGKSAVTSNTLKIAAAAKVQNLTVTAEVTFVDGTKSTATKVIKAVENNLGYFAIPVVTIDGVERIVPITGTPSGTATIALETSKANKTSINTATVEFMVFHILDATGAEYAKNVTALATEDAIASAIGKHIEPVDPDEIDWTKATLIGTGEYSDYYTISGGEDGTYTITAKAKMDGADELKFSAKVGNYAVLTPADKLQVSVAMGLDRIETTIGTADASAAEGFNNPEFSADYISELENRAEEVLVDGYKGAVTGYQITGVVPGSKITLPSVDAFDATSIDPARSLAGWKVVDNNGTAATEDDDISYKPADGTAIVTADVNTTYTAVWASKYNNVKAYNANTNEVLTDATKVAVGAEIPVTIGYHALNPAGINIVNGAIDYEVSATILDPADIATELKITSTDAQAARFVTTSATEGDVTTYTFTGNKLKAASTQTTTDPVSLIVVWKDNGVEEYAVSGVKADIVPANDWVFEMDPIVLEVDQVKTVGAKTFTLQGAVVDFADEIFAPKTLDCTVAKEDVAEIIETTPSANSFTFKGLKVGTTTFTVSFIDLYGAEKVYEIPVTVKAAAHSINATYIAAASDGELVAPTETVIEDGDVVLLPINGANSTITLSISDKDTFSGTKTFGVTSIELSAEETAAGITPATFATLSTTEAGVVSVQPNSLGRAYLKATMTVTEDEITSQYERVFCIESYGLVKVYGPDSSADITLIVDDPSTAEVDPVNVKEDKAFAVYTDSSKATKVTADKFAVVPVYYDPSVTSNYTIDLSDFTAEWTNTTISQEFLGWGVGQAQIRQSSAATSLTIAKGDVPTGKSVYAYFKNVAITLHGGYNKTITLSDENVITSDAGQTYAGAVSVNVLPKDSVSQINVIADKKDIIAIADVATGAYDSIIGWDGTAAVSVPAGGAGDTYRVDNFYIAKAPGGVGTVTLSLRDGAEVADTITVYANGQYTENEKTYYMLNGENLKSGSAVVQGKTHFFDENGELVKGRAYFSDNDGAWILAAATTGDQITVKGIYTINNKSYYVDEDGFVMTGFFNGLVKQGTKKDDDKTYYADPEDPGFVINDLATVAGVTYYFDNNGHMAVSSASANAYELVAGTNYYVNAEGHVAIGGLFTVDGVQRLFRADGTIVNYTDSDVVDGKIQVGETVYVIAEDGSAEADHEHKWSVVGWNWSSDYSSATVSFECAVGKEVVGPYTATVASTTAGSLTTYTAKYTFSGKEYEDTQAAYQKPGEDTPTPIDPEQAEAVVNKGLYVEGIYDTVYDGTAKKMSNLKAYWFTGDEQVLLVEGTDYTVKYANNKNAGTATITLTGKGQYANLFTAAYNFTIKKAEFGEDVWPSYTNNVLTGSKTTFKMINDLTNKAIPAKAFTATLESAPEGASALAYGKAYTVAGDYEWKITPVDTVNYSGEAHAIVTVANKADTITADKLTVKILEKAAISKDSAAPTPKFSVKYGKETIMSDAEGFSDKFEVYWSNENAGTGYVHIVAQDGCTLGGKNVIGSKSQKFTITGTKLSSVKSAFDVLKKTEVPYTGYYWYLEDVLEYLGITDFAKDIDYYYNVKNNLKKGTMTFTFYGRGIYEGKVTETVKIRALNQAAEGEYTIILNGSTYGGPDADLIEVPFTAGGAVVANLQVYALDNYMLREGVDYTVSYKDNKTVGATATLTIKGKGNYGKATATFKVIANEVDEGDVYSLPIEVAAAAKADGKKAPAIYDSVTGKKLTANKDFTYEYGTLDSDTGLLPVTLKNGSEGTYDFGDGFVIDDGYHVYQTAITKKLVSVTGTYYYTGTAITLGEDDFSGLKLGEDFVIVGYKNNIKAGTGKVTVKGIGKYGKTATLSFKINKFQGK